VHQQAATRTKPAVGRAVQAQPAAQRAGRPQPADAVFSALASPQRRAILSMLAEAERGAVVTCCGPPDVGAEVCACRFSERLGLSAPTISHHMKQLLDAGLVTARKQGQWVHYTLRREALDEAAAALKEL
jgi:ArsR family transcriptional regulator, arsenate/arsenite/antimonite-responsive transcriptional repressor